MFRLLKIKYHSRFVGLFFSMLRRSKISLYNCFNNLFTVYICVWVIQTYWRKLDVYFDLLDFSLYIFWTTIMAWSSFRAKIFPPWNGFHTQIMLFTTAWTKRIPIWSRAKIFPPWNSFHADIMLCNDFITEIIIKNSWSTNIMLLNNFMAIKRLSYKLW